MLIVDQYRFGWATFPDVRSISDERVLRFLPEYAKEITLFRRPGGNGFIGRFKISEKDLSEWDEAHWKRFLTANENSPPSPTGQKISSEEFQDAFRESDWKPPNDLLGFRGPTARNGAGYRIFFSPEQQQAYIHAGYW